MNIAQKTALMELTADLILRAVATVVTIYVVSGPLKRILKSLRLSYRLRHLPGKCMVFCGTVCSCLASKAVPRLTFSQFLQARPAPPSSWAMPSSGSGQTGTECSPRTQMHTGPSTTRGLWTAM
jgi:hypothetical protein